MKVVLFIPGRLPVGREAKKGIISYFWLWAITFVMDCRLAGAFRPGVKK
jgi:hypothetical protein